MSTLLDLVMARHLSPAPRRVADTHGGEWHSPCPVCGGKDRFHFWPERRSTGACDIPGVWGCRHCDKSGDAIAFLMHADGISFKEACSRLGQKISVNEYAPAALPRRAAPQKLELAPAPKLPDQLWREKTTALARHAHEQLLKNRAVLAWLQKRGLGLGAVRRFQLGWLPGEERRGEVKSWYVRPRSVWGLENEQNPDGTVKRTFRIPRGLTIPRWQDNEVVSLRIRRTDEDRDLSRGGSLPHLKYMVFKGAPVMPLICPSFTAPEFSALVVVESELDAMLVAEAAFAASLPVGAAALCSNTARPVPALHDLCSRSARILLCLDYESKNSGGKVYTDKALLKWIKTYPHALDWPVPEGKDPGEAFERGTDIALWLGAGLPDGLRPSSGSLLQSISTLPTDNLAAAPEILPEKSTAPVMPESPVQEPAPAEKNTVLNPAPFSIEHLLSLDFEAAYELALELMYSSSGLSVARTRRGRLVPVFNNFIMLPYEEPDWSKAELLNRLLRFCRPLGEYLHTLPYKLIDSRNFKRQVKS